MSFVVTRSSVATTVPESSRDELQAEAITLGRACLAGAFLVVIFCSILKSSGAHTPYMGGLLGLSAGLVSAFVFLGWQRFTDDLARLRRASARR